MKTTILSLFIFLLGFTVAGQPVITNISPTYGPVGTSVTIAGSNFSTVPANNIVFYGGIRTVVLAATASSLTISIPAGTNYQAFSILVNNRIAYSNQKFVVTFSGGGAFAAGSFGGKTDFITAANPIDICTADFNDDGKPDIATANNLANLISVFKNEGGPATILFGTKIDLATNSAPQGIHTGDVDGDGKSDLLVTCVGAPGTVSVYRNTSTNGNISFASKIDFSTGNDPTHVVVHDMDSDGKPELIISNYNSSSISILKNTTTGNNISFATKVDFTTGTLLPRRLVINDFDDDGKPDIAVAAYNSTTSALYIFKNNGNSGNISFLPFVQYAAAGGSWSIDAGDLDADGKADIAMVNYSNRTLSVFKNKSTSGTISFDNKIDFATGGLPESITINDFNGDGKPDIAVGNYSDHTLSVFNNTSTSGTISFAGKFDYTTGTNPRGICSADFDTDGKADIATANINGGNMSVIRNNIAAVAAQVPVINSFSPSTGAIGADIVINGANFDASTSSNIVYFGSTQAIVSSATSSALTVKSPVGLTYEPISVTTGGLSAYSGRPYAVTFSGGDVSPASYTEKKDFTAGTYPRHSNLGDIDGDGKSDIVIVNQNDATISVHQNRSSANSINFATGLVYTLPGATSFASAKGDVDGDGKPDIVVANYAAGSVSIFRNTSTPGTITLASRIDYPAGLDAISLSIADFDGDGKPDIAILNNNPNTVSVLKNYSTPGNISFGALSNYATGVWPQSCITGDVDGDAKPDIIVTNHTSNTISVLRNISTAGSIAFAAKLDFATDTNPFNLAIGDLDADSKNDLVVGNSSSSSLSVFKNNSTPGNISLGNPITLTTGLSPLGITITDVDGDGKPDINVANFNANSFSIFKNTGNSNISFAAKVDFITPQLPRFVNVGDLDGDGKPEIITANSLGNNFSVFRNQSNEYATIVFCANSDTTLVSDKTGTTYQWQVNTGTGFVTIFDNSNYAGTGTQNLKLINIPINWSNYQYRCKADGNYSKTFLLNPVTSFTPSVSITSSTSSICAGSAVTFTASVINGGNAPVFQWQLNNVNIGTNKAFITIDTLRNGDQVKVKLTSSISCTSPATVTSNTITTSVDKLDTPIININDIILTITNPDAAAVYKWEVQNSSAVWESVLPVINGVVFTASTSGIYRAKGTKGQCVVFSLADTIVILPRAPEPVYIVARAYPNPVQNELILDSIKLTDKWETLTIINSNGTQTILPVDIKNKTKVVVPIAHLTPGFYFAVLRNKNKKTGQVKFLKE